MTTPRPYPFADHNRPRRPSPYAGAPSALGPALADLDAAIARLRATLARIPAEHAPAVDEITMAALERR